MLGDVKVDETIGLDMPFKVLDLLVSHGQDPVAIDEEGLLVVHFKYFAYVFPQLGQVVIPVEPEPASIHNYKKNGFLNFIFDEGAL